MSTTGVVGGLPEVFRGEASAGEQLRVLLVFGALAVLVTIPGTIYFQRKDL